MTTGLSLIACALAQEIVADEEQFLERLRAALRQPPVTIGTAKRFRLHDLNRWLDSRTVRAKEIKL